MEGLQIVELDGFWTRLYTRETEETLFHWVTLATWVIWCYNQCIVLFLVIVNGPFIFAMASSATSWNSLFGVFWVNPSFPPTVLSCLDWLPLPCSGMLKISVLNTSPIQLVFRWIEFMNRGKLFGLTGIPTCD